MNTVNSLFFQKQNKKYKYRIIGYSCTRYAVYLNKISVEPISFIICSPNEVTASYAC